MSFEEIIKKKTGTVRMHPSLKIWEVLQQEMMRTFHPAINFPMTVVLTLIFSMVYSRISAPATSMLKIRNHYNYSDYDRGEAALVSKSIITNSKKSTSKENSYFIKRVKHEILHKENYYFYKIIPINRPVSSIEVFDDAQKAGDLIQERDIATIRNKILPALPHSISADDALRFRTKVNAVQLYFSPSVGYSLLMEGNNREKNPNYFSDDSVSIYLPSASIEAGIALWQPINDKWAIKSGIQVNMSKYETKPIQSPEDVTLIKSGEPKSSAKMQTPNGKKMMNQNFRFSVPVELEYKLAGNKALSVFMSGSLQPSFSIYSNGSIITSEFKDQVAVDPYLYRRFNVLTGLECFFRLNAGSFDIQAGPQVRYQLLSNNLVASPYREHIMDYSMKIGIIKKIP